MRFLHICIAAEENRPDKIIKFGLQLMGIVIFNGCYRRKTSSSGREITLNETLLIDYICAAWQNIFPLGWE